MDLRQPTQGPDQWRQEGLRGQECEQFPLQEPLNPLVLIFQHPIQSWFHLLTYSVFATSTIEFAGRTSMTALRSIMWWSERRGRGRRKRHMRRKELHPPSLRHIAWKICFGLHGSHMTNWSETLRVLWMVELFLLPTHLYVLTQPAHPFRRPRHQAFQRVLSITWTMKERMAIEDSAPSQKPKPPTQEEEASCVNWLGYIYMAIFFYISLGRETKTKTLHVPVWPS